MNCEKVSRLINDLHDGAIDDEVRIGMEKHIAVCPTCRAASDRLRALSVLLRKDVAPAPSPALDRKLMLAFAEKHERPLKSPAWWRTIFAGSLSIPKPAFAAALIAVAAAIGAANLIGRNAAVATGADTASTAPVISQPMPQVTETTKIVEVPVIKESVVTKIVYVKRENGGVNKTLKKSLYFNSLQASAVDKNRVNLANTAAPNLPMSGSVAENGYFTRTDLTDFEPAAEGKIRIIKKEKTDEK